MRRALASLAWSATAVLAQQPQRTALPTPYPYDLRPVDAIRGHLIQGEFKEPSAICFDRQARELFVADAKSHLIGIFDPDGIPVFTFGGPNRLHEPHAITIDANGRPWVVDADRAAVKIFNYRGELEATLTFEYPAATGFDAGVARIGGLAFGPGGLVYVLDLALPQILVYDAGLSFQRFIRPQENGPAFEILTDIAIAADGTVAVTDFKATPVQLFDAKGKFLLGFGKRDVAREDFTAPVAVTFDDHGRLFVVDMLRHEVKIFDRAGNFIGQFGGWYSPETGGRSPGELLYPFDIAIDGKGRLYVAERVGRRVQIFEPVAKQDGTRQPPLRIPAIPRIEQPARDH